MRIGILILICFPMLTNGQNPYSVTSADSQKYQPVADTTHFPRPFEFTFVDSVKESKIQIYRRGKEYFAKSLSNIRAGEVLKDSVAGKIVIHYIKGATYYDEENYFDLQFDCKDELVKLRLNNYTNHDESFGLRSLDSAVNQTRTDVDTNKVELWNL